MQIHIWCAESEETELLMTPEQDAGKAPAPQTGGGWVYRGVTTRNRHSTEPLPGGISWEEINAAFSFSGYWSGAGDLEGIPLD